MIQQILFIMVLLTVNAFSQDGTVSSGGDTKSESGSVSYSIGQVSYETQSGDGDVQPGLQQTYRIVISSIKEGESNISIELYPNPTTDNVVLKIDESDFSGLEYSLVNLLGITVFNNSINSTETNIDTSDLTASSYILNVLKEGKIIQSFNLIKSK